MDEVELLTIDEMANRLKVKKSWLYARTCQDGTQVIPHLKVGKYLRFNPAAVMPWILKTYGDR